MRCVTYGVEYINLEYLKVYLNLALFNVLMHFATRKRCHILCEIVPRAEQVILIHLTSNQLTLYRRPFLIKIWQTLYNRPPRCTPDQPMTREEWNHSGPFCHWLKIIPLNTTSQSGTNLPPVFQTNIRSPRSRPAHIRSVYFSRSLDIRVWSVL